MLVADLGWREHRCKGFIFPGLRRQGGALQGKNRQGRGERRQKIFHFLFALVNK
jgi:hypothetical protein